MVKNWSPYPRYQCLRVYVLSSRPSLHIEVYRILLMHTTIVILFTKIWLNTEGLAQQLVQLVSSQNLIRLNLIYLSQRKAYGIRLRQIGSVLVYYSTQARCKCSHKLAWVYCDINVTQGGIHVSFTPVVKQRIMSCCK